MYVFIHMRNTLNVDKMDGEFFYDLSLKNSQNLSTCDVMSCDVKFGHNNTRVKNILRSNFIEYFIIFYNSISHINPRLSNIRHVVLDQC